MARWSDLSKLRMDMEMLHAKINAMYSRGHNASDIADAIQVPERNIRVIIKWRC